VQAIAEGRQNEPTNFLTEGRYNARLQEEANELFRSKLQLSSDGTPRFESSFTFITIQLREDTKRMLFHENSYKRLPTQLLDVYYFHLHPEQLPDEQQR
jgi:hypothetical protein